MTADATSETELCGEIEQDGEVEQDPETESEAGQEPETVAVEEADGPADAADADADEPARADGPADPATTAPTPPTILTAFLARWSAGRPKILYAALAMIAAQLVLREVFLHHLSFIQDDFDFQNHAATQGLGWTYLMHIHANHLMPGSLFIAWVLTRISPLNWTLTSASVLVMQLAASLAVFRMLRVLFGTRPAILIPFAVYVFSALDFAATSWWAAAIQLLPLQAVAALAVASHVEYLRTGVRGHLIAELCYVVLALTFIGKAVAVPELLFVLTICYFTGKTTFVAAIVETVRRHWPLWLGYGLLLTGYDWLYTARLHAEHVNITRIDSVSDIWGFAWRMVADTFTPTVVGGPWRWFTVPDSNALASPPTALVRISWIALIGAIAASVYFRRRAARAWGILLGYLLLGDVIPTLIGRMGSSQAVYIPLAAMETHYVADAAPILALCLGLAFLPIVGEADPYRRPLPTDPRFQGLAQALVGGAAVLGVVGLVVSTVTYYQGVNGRVSRTFVANARAALHAGTDGSVIMDTIVDPRLMVPWVGTANFTSQVLGAVATKAQRDAMQNSLGLDGAALAFDTQGRLRPVTGLRPDSTIWSWKGAAAPPGPTPLGYCFGGAATATYTPAPFVDVSLSTPVEWKQWMVQIAYIDHDASDLTVQSGFSVRHLKLPAAPNGHVITLMMQPSGSVFRFSGATSASGMCVSSLTVGFPVFG